MTSTSRSGFRYLCFTLSLLAAVGSVQADGQQSFFWGFLKPINTSLPECQRLQIFVNTSGMAATAQPPFYFFAYEAGGIATRQALGSDPNNLTWTVDHASQSQLVLSMADAAGNSGGVAPALYTVVSSSAGTACHPANPTSSVTLTTNATKSIASCDVLPLMMSGGKKPYTISIAAIGAIATINVTLDPQFDTIDWVNRAAPNTQIITSVSDGNGVYGGSTNLISTFGSTDLTCGDRPSTEIDSTGQSSGQSVASSNSSSSNGNSSHGSSSHKFSTPALAGVIAGSVAVIAVVALGLCFCLRRRRANANRPGEYSAINLSNEFGSGGVRRAGEPYQYSNAAEMTPFVAGAGPSTPYTDNPQHQRSVDSRAPSEMSLGPLMQARASTYSPPFTASPTASSFTMQRNTAPSAFSPPASNTAASFDLYQPYSTGPIPPSSPLETTGLSIAGPSVSSTYAAYAGSVVESARTGEAGPSSGLFVVADTAGRESSPEKQGPVPPAVPRESVYQHEDISDVTELPPAYKERTEL